MKKKTLGHGLINIVHYPSVQTLMMAEKPLPEIVARFGMAEHGIAGLRQIPEAPARQGQLPARCNLHISELGVGDEPQLHERVQL